MFPSVNVSVLRQTIQLYYVATWVDYPNKFGNVDIHLIKFILVNVSNTLIFILNGTFIMCMLYSAIGWRRYFCSSIFGNTMLHVIYDTFSLRWEGNAYNVLVVTLPWVNDHTDITGSICMCLSYINFKCVYNCGLLVLLRSRLTS